MDLKIKDVADLLHVSETTIRRWLADRKIPAYRINHQYRFDRVEIENWMMQCKLRSETPAQPTQIYCSEDSQKKTPSSSRSGVHQFCLFRAIHQGDVLSDLKGNEKEGLIRAATKVIGQTLGVDAGNPLGTLAR